MILDCGLIELVQNVVTMRSVILKCYDAIGIKVTKNSLQGLMCSKYLFVKFSLNLKKCNILILDINDSLDKKRTIFSKKAIPSHPPVFRNWYLKEFPSPGEWSVHYNCIISFSVNLHFL